jgi:hypothetical protein
LRVTLDKKITENGASGVYDNKTIKAADQVELDKSLILTGL